MKVTAGNTDFTYGLGGGRVGRGGQVWQTVSTESRSVI